MVYVIFPEDFLMKYILSFCSAILAFALLSCGSNSSTSTSGFSIDPTSLVAPSPAAVACSFTGVTIGGIPYSPNNYCFAVVYQSTTQTGVSVGIYDPTPGPTQGLEIAKIMFYADNISALPTTDLQTVPYSSSSTGGGLVVKYAANSSGIPQLTPMKTALVRQGATGTVNFSLQYHSAYNGYSVNSISFPSLSSDRSTIPAPNVAITSITQAVTAQ